MKNISTLVTFALGLAAYFVFRRAGSSQSLPTLVLGWALLLGALFVSVFTHRITSEERRGRFRALLDIRRPREKGRKVFQLVAWLVFFFGSLLLFLRILPVFVLLDEGLYFAPLYALPVLLLISFVIPKSKELNQSPIVQNLTVRVAYCVPAAALLFSVVMILNCAHDKSVRKRTVTCLAKQRSRGHDPRCYIRVRPWTNTDRTVFVDVPEVVYALTPVGTPFEITTGIGNLGIEWIRSIDTAGRHSSGPDTSQLR